MTVKQFSAEHNFNVTTIQKWIRTGKIDAFRIKVERKFGGSPFEYRIKLTNKTMKHVTAVKEKRDSFIEVKKCDAWTYRRDLMGYECSESTNYLYVDKKRINKPITEKTYWENQ